MDIPIISPEIEEDEIEKLMAELYETFEKDIKNRKKNGRQINQSHIIPITLFYVAKSQKESAQISRKMNILTGVLVLLTICLVILTIMLILKT